MKHCVDAQTETKKSELNYEWVETALLTLYRAERRRQSGVLTWHARQPDADLTAVNNMTLFYS